MTESAARRPASWQTARMRSTLALLALAACGGRIEGDNAAPDASMADAPSPSADAMVLIDGGLVLGPCDFTSRFRPNGGTFAKVADVQGTSHGSRADGGQFTLICGGTGNAGFYYELFFKPLALSVGTQSVGLYMLINTNGRDAESSDGICTFVLSDIGTKQGYQAVTGTFDCPSMPMTPGTYALGGSFVLFLP